MTSAPFIPSCSNCTADIHGESIQPGRCLSVLSWIFPDGKLEKSPSFISLFHLPCAADTWQCPVPQRDSWGGISETPNCSIPWKLMLPMFPRGTGGPAGDQLFWERREHAELQPVFRMPWNDLNTNRRMVRNPCGQFQLFPCGLKLGFAPLV